MYICDLGLLWTPVRQSRCHGEGDAQSYKTARAKGLTMCLEDTGRSRES